MTGYPCVVILISIVFLFAFQSVGQALERTAEDTPDSNFQPWYWREHQASGALRWMRDKNNEDAAEDEEDEDEEDEIEDKFRFEMSETIFFMWERCPKDVASPDCNFDMFSDEVLQDIADAEKALASWDKWEEKYCTLYEINQNRTHARCMAPFTFMNYVHKDPVQVEKLLDNTDKGDDAIEGEFDYFGALCLPMTKAVSTKTMYDLSALPEPAKDESTCVPEGATTTSTTSASAPASSNSSAHPEGCQVAQSPEVCFQQDQNGAPVDQAICASFGGTWGCVPGCEHPQAPGVCFNEQGGAAVDQAMCAAAGAMGLHSRVRASRPAQRVLQ
jgi:hypothetical protein